MQPDWDSIRNLMKFTYLIVIVGLGLSLMFSMWTSVNDSIIDFLSRITVIGVTGASFSEQMTGVVALGLVGIVILGLTRIVSGAPALRAGGSKKNDASDVISKASSEELVAELEKRGQIGRR